MRRPKRTTACALMIGALGSALLASGSLASPGELDRTFSGDGRALAGFGHDRVLGWFGEAKLAVGPNSEPVVAISTMRRRRFSDDVAVFRFRRDGRLDRSFATNGRKDIHIPGTLETPVGVAVRPNGKIVVAADNGPGTELIQLRRNGRFDKSFGNGGVIGPTASLGHTSAMELDSHGRVLLAGSKWVSGASPPNGDFTLRRLTTTGEIDGSFGNDGLTTVDFLAPSEAGAESADRAIDLTTAPDDSILVSGTSTASGAAPPNPYEERVQRTGGAVARLDEDGALDAGFSGDGRVLIGPEAGVAESKSYEDGAGNAIAVGADGSVTVGGIARENFVITRLTPHGLVQEGFGDDGTTEVEGGEKFALADALALDPRGNPLLAGSVLGPHSRDYAVVGVGAELGNPLPDFGRRGTVRVEFEREWDDADGIEVLPGGKVLVAGTVGDRQIGVVRLLGR